jgi:hypothetical protein
LVAYAAKLFKALQAIATEIGAKVEAMMLCAAQASITSKAARTAQKVGDGSDAMDDGSCWYAMPRVMPDAVAE